MPDYSGHYESGADMLKAVDLQGREYKLTIAGAELLDLAARDDPKPDQKVVLRFRETEKRFPLNKTNYYACAEAMKSNNTDFWLGKQITVFPSRTDSPRGIVDCVRIKSAEAAGRPQATPAAAAILTGRELQQQQSPPQTPVITQAEIDEAGDDSIPF